MFPMLLEYGFKASRALLTGARFSVDETEMTEIMNKIISVFYFAEWKMRLNQPLDACC